MTEGVTNHMQKDTIVLDREAAERVQALLEMGFGRLNITDGADAMMEGVFAYGDPSYKPEVSYGVRDNIGRLIMHQPQKMGRSIARDHSDWKVSFNKGIPLDLDIRVASGETSVNLSEAHLTALASKVGSGKFATTLTGTMDSLAHVVMKTASGRTHAVLNGTFPKLENYSVSSASGIVTTALGGTFSELGTLDVRTASGTVDLGLAGAYPALRRITIDTVSGAGDLNLVDAAFSDLTLALNCVSGAHVIRCPCDVGVGLHFKSLTGQIDAPALHRVKGMFVNDLYGDAETTLEISISSVSGRVSVQLSEA